MSYDYGQSINLFANPEERAKFDADVDTAKRQLHQMLNSARQTADKIVFDILNKQELP